MGGTSTESLTGRSTRRVDATTLAALDSFLAVGLLGVYLKFAFLGQHWGAVARFLGKSTTQELTAFDRLGFFFADISLSLLVLPVAATCVVALLSRRHRLVIAFGSSVLVALLYFAELRAQSEVGQYLTWDALGDLVRYGATTPEVGLDYVTTASLLKLGLLLTTLLVIAAAGRTALWHETSAASTVAWWVLLCPAVAIVGCAFLLAPLSYAHRLPDSLLNVSAVSRVVSTLAVTSRAEGSATATLAELLERSRRQTRTPPLRGTHALVGLERDSDLVVFMMETGPAEALDLAVSAAALPGAGALYRRSFIGARHYTTYPYSSDAMYSFLSGMYPQGRRRVLRASQGRRLNGLMTGLLDDFPVRRVYVPSLYHLELDQPMYTAFGADTLYAADEQRDASRDVGQQRAEALMRTLTMAPLSDNQRRLLGARLRSDYQALDKMKSDIAEAVRANRRYAVMYFPEIGHAPWIPLHGERTPVERGRTLMRLQDHWLKEVVDVLQSLGRLDRTVIVITADHGIRTRVEDPALPPGKVSDYMFRVPLLVYAPQTLQAPHPIGTPTSHIDVAPTVLALFGHTAEARPMQGVPIWQRTPANRIFFFASAYGGADGFVENGAYYMRQTLSGAVYVNTDLSFGDSNQVRPGGDLISYVRDAIASSETLQYAIAARTATTAVPMAPVAAIR